MPQLGIRYAGRDYTWDEARAAAEEDASFPYPPPLIEAMADRREDKQPSASSISDCLRRFELKRTLDYYGDPNKELPPIFGTAFHAEMDKYRQKLLQPGDLSETRLYANLDVWVNDDPLPRSIRFGGQFDFFRPGVLLSDWKSKSYIPVGFTVQENHVKQANIYNWLAYKNGYEPAAKWEIAYVSNAWAVRKQGVMQPLARVESFLRQRLTAWAQAAGSGTLPPPVSALFEADAKGKPPAPCSYCDVREQCRAALKESAPRPFGSVVAAEMALDIPVQP